MHLPARSSAPCLATARLATTHLPTARFATARFATALLATALLATALLVGASSAGCGGGDANTGGGGAGGSTSSTGGVGASDSTSSSGGVGAGDSTSSSGSGGTGGSLPSGETCATTADEDDDGIECGLWGHVYGDLEQQTPAGLALAPSGDLYLSGGLAFSGPGSIVFGGQTLTSTGPADRGFLAKLGPDGEELWAKQLPAFFNIAMLPSGGVVGLMFFEGTVDVGGGPLVAVGGDDIAVAAFDEDGNHLWSRSLPVTLDAYPDSLAVTPTGDVVVTGAFQGHLDAGDQSYDSVFDSTDLFLISLDGATGATSWSRTFGESGFELSIHMAVDASGDIFLAGDYDGPIAFGGASLPVGGGQASYLAKLDADGNHLASARFCKSCLIKQIVTTPGGGPLVTGYITDTATIGAQTFVTNGILDVFLAKADDIGTPVWAQSYGDVVAQSQSRVSVSPAGDIALLVELDGSADFGGGTLTSAGATDIALVRLSPDGDHLYSRLFGDKNYQSPGQLVFHPNGEMTMTAALFGTTTFGTTTLTAAGVGAGESDIGLVHLAP